MLSVRRPDADALREFLQRQSTTSLSYSPAGMTSGAPAPGWTVGREEIDLGSGSDAYERARAAVDQWAMFDVGWVELLGADHPPAEGVNVAVLARLGALWSLNACRVVRLIRDRGDHERYGFAYGTLDEHMEAGEERFVVTWDRAADRVTYEVVAYSRPRHWLARATGPLARSAQRRFRVDSARAMQRAVA